MSTARRWKRQDTARRGPPLSCLAMVEGPDWWCWLQKWQDGGARRPPSSSPPWPMRCRGRWSAILACSAARAFSLSLLDQCPVPQGCESPSAHEVLRDDRFTWGPKTPPTFHEKTPREREKERVRERERKEQKWEVGEGKTERNFGRPCGGG